MKSTGPVPWKSRSRPSSVAVRMRKTVEPQIGTSIDLQLASGSSGCLIPAKALKLRGLSSGPREPSVKTQSLPPSEHGMDCGSAA